MGELEMSWEEPGSKQVVRRFIRAWGGLRECSSGWDRNANYGP